MYHLLQYVFIILLDATLFFFFFNDTATTEIYTLSLHDALPISSRISCGPCASDTLRSHASMPRWKRVRCARSEEHTSELQSPDHLVCRLLLEKKKKKNSEGKQVWVCVAWTRMSRSGGHAACGVV